MNLRAIVVSVALPVALGLGAFWAHDHFNLSLEVTLAAAGLAAIGVAAAALFPAAKKSRIEVDHPYLTITRPEQGDWVRVEFEATAVNAGEQRVMLTKVECLLYRLDGLRCDVNLAFGAQDTATLASQPLPCLLEPGKTYRVKGYDSTQVESPLGRILGAGERHDFVMRCRLRFKGARSITLRIHPHDPNGRPPWLRSLITELRIRS